MTAKGSADGKFTGEANVKIVDPHSNRDEVDRTDKRGRQYDKQGHMHIPTATVELDRSKRGLKPLRFEAHHHQLAEAKQEEHTKTEKDWIAELKTNQKEFEKKTGKLGLRYDAELTGDRVPADQLTGYMKMLGDYQRSNLEAHKDKMEGVKYGGMEDYLLHEGKEFDVPDDPPQVKLGTPKECYSNCDMRALREPAKYDYAEGKYVSPRLPFPIDHAWLVDKQTGKVVDPTLGWQPKARYFGVQYSKQFVTKKLLQNKYHGLHSGGVMLNDIVLGRDKDYEYGKKRGTEHQ